MTRQETIATYLLQNGCQEVIPSRSRKYRQFTTPKGNTYWLGRMGAVRKGKSVSSSISLTQFVDTKKIASKIQNTNPGNQK